MRTGLCSNFFDSTHIKSGSEGQLDYLPSIDIILQTINYLSDIIDRVETFFHPITAYILIE